MYEPFSNHLITSAPNSMEYRKPLRALQKKKKQEYKVDLVFFRCFVFFLFDDIKKYIAVHEPS